MKKRLTFLIMLILFLLGNSLRLSAEQRPPRLRGEVHQVQVSLFMIDIKQINDVDQSITVDFAVRMLWRDTSLIGQQRQVSVKDAEGIWYPEVQIANSIDLTPTREDILEIYEDGRVLYRQRYAGDVSIQTDFSKFPFDRHVFGIDVAVINLDSVELSREVGLGNYLPEKLSISGWNVRKGELIVGKGKGVLRNFQIFGLTFEADRQERFYLFKVLFPLTLVVVMSWMVFWINPDSLQPQLTVSVTAILTMVAFQFTISNTLPPLSYLTRMDIFILGANVLVFVTLIEAIFVNKLVVKGFEEKAKRVDRICRWLFPALYLSICLLAINW